MTKIKKPVDSVRLIEMTKKLIANPKLQTNDYIAQELLNHIYKLQTELETVRNDYINRNWFV
jgi:hypothetical protein